MAENLHRSRLGFCLLAVSAFVLPACSSDGHIHLLGYTSAPNYDCSIRTVHVPIFKNKTFWRGVEFELTRAVIREIEAKTPYKVVDTCAGADTELTGVIVNRRKAVINANQLGEVREAEVGLAVEVIWRDLRPGHGGEILSVPLARKDGEGTVPPGGKTPPPGPQPVLISPTATFIPEVGGSLASAENQLVNQLAIQIISMMEIWRQ